MTLEDHLATAAPAQRADLDRLHAIIRATTPQLELEVTPNMLGYGPYHYRYATGREGDAHLVSVAARKRHISLYVNSADDGGYLAEQFAARLPNADVGRSCVRFKRLDDLDVAVLEELLRAAAAQGPMGGVDAA